MKRRKRIYYNDTEKSLMWVWCLGRDGKKAKMLKTTYTRRP